LDRGHRDFSLADSIDEAGRRMGFVDMIRT
jgi:hypothetical protein